MRAENAGRTRDQFAIGDIMKSRKSLDSVNYPETTLNHWTVESVTDSVSLPYSKWPISQVPGGNLRKYKSHLSTDASV